MFVEGVAERFGRSRVRVAIVLAFAVLSLATALPNYLANAYPIYGHFGFVTDESWHVVASFRKPLKAGDVIDWRRLPLSERYDTADFPRLARAGTRVTFPVIRNGKRLNVTLVSEYHAQRFGGPSRRWIYGLKKGSELLIVLLGAALVLIRPTRLSALFFIYVGALATDGPEFWSFLPADVLLALMFVACFAAFSLPPVALLLFAIDISGEASSGWRALVRGFAPYLFVCSAALIALWIAREYFAILAGAWVPFAGTFALVFSWLLAILTLAAEAVGAWRRRARAVTLASIALAGSGLCYLYIDTASLFESNVVGYNDFWALLSLVLSLAAVYAVVRGRIIDVRLYITRAALSAAIGSLIVAAFSLLNLIFVAQIARVPYAVPVEILIAAWLGFRLSGLQDVAAATTIIAKEAPDARYRGDRLSERDLFVRALVRAERTRNATLIATVRAHAAFGAWCAGDDEEFSRHMYALQRVAGERRIRALGRFASIGQSGCIPDAAPSGELPEWTARTELLVCTGSDDAVDAGKHAALAAAAAEASGDPFLEMVALIALAEFQPAERARLYERAQSCCKTLASLPLLESVRALACGKSHGKWLDAFVNEHLRRPRLARPTLDVRFADTSVRAYGAEIELRHRELALLLTIAQTREGASFEKLADTLWPDLDGDAARNVLHVTLHRLRRALGDDAMITRTASRYRLRDGAVVDTWDMRALLVSTADGRLLTEHERRRLRDVSEALRTGEQRRPTDQEWFLETERMIARLYRDIGQRLSDDEAARTQEHVSAASHTASKRP